VKRRAKQVLAPHALRRQRPAEFDEPSFLHNLAGIVRDYRDALPAAFRQQLDELGKWVSGRSTSKPVREAFDVDYKGGARHRVRLRWEAEGDDKPSWVDFEIAEVVGVERRGAHVERLYAGDMSPTTDLDEASFPVRGFVKRDGCTQFWVECAHADSSEDLDVALGAIRVARQRALLAMGGDPKQ
jgi:hypothetical protein